jgi:uncharacterized protein YndB with AHSA1/START domain
MAIHQEVVIPAAPDRVYAALTNAAQLTKLSGGAPTELAATEGGAFSFFGGAVVGRNIEMVPNARLVQAWRNKDWEPGVYSVVRFALSAEGKGTKLVFDHSGFPPDQEQHLTEGWPQFYWEPLKKLFTS